MNYRVNILFILSFVFTSLGSLNAQVVEWSPNFSTEFDSLEIIFDATKGNGELAGFTGDVFLHTGVITNQSTTPSDWKFVQSGWESFPEKLKAEPLGDDKWRFSYTPTVREFFGITDSNIQVQEVAMLFRGVENGSITGVGRDSGGADIFVPLSEAGLNLLVANPADGSGLVDIGETFEIVVVAQSDFSDQLTISLLLDENEVTSADNDTLTYEFTPQQSGNFDFTVTVTDGDGNSEEDAFRLVAVPEVVEEARPAGLEDGITFYEDDPGKVSFSFFAPGKENAFLIGDFNDWSEDADFFMKLDQAREDSAHFWITIDGLTPGEEYRFQYLIDGELRIADLYSEVVLDPDFDQFISSSIFPDMPQYPEGLTSEIVSVFTPGKESFDWEVPDFERPDPEELVIYELLLRDFLEESSFQVLADTLDYLDRLGINAIELMPVSHFDGNISWGYNPVFHGALDKSYGSPDSFKRFIDEAHKRGIAVILDVVYNHAVEKSPLIRLYGLGQQNNRFIGPGHAFNVFQHLNHDDPYIQYWLDRMNRFWLEEYNIDGYRFDLTKGFATNVQDGSLLQGPNQDRIENLKRMNNKIREFDQTAYVILEHFADNSEEQQLEKEGMLLWGNHNFNYAEGVMSFNSGGNSNMSGIYFGNRGFTNPNLVGYMESHDEQWIMLKARKFGNNSNENHTPRDLDTALERKKLAGAFFFTIPGPKMIWQFGELGYGWGQNECLKPGDGSNGDCLNSDPGRTAPKPIRWDYRDDENRRSLYYSWSDLITLRNSSPVFTSAETEFSSFLNGNTKWIKLEHPDMDAVIIGNFDVVEQDRQITFTQEGTWFDFFNGDALSISETEQTFTLQPGEFRIFTTSEIEPVFTSAETENPLPDVPAKFELRQNFPNPFNPSTQLRFDMPEATNVTLEVFDMLGRRVAVLLNNDIRPAGSHTVQFDASMLGSGVYIARMTAGNIVKTQKMTLIK